MYLGIQTVWVLDAVLQHGDIDDSRRWYWLAGDIAFALVFVIELTLRVFAYQVKFYTGSQRWWNAFDCFTLIATVVAVLLDLLGPSDSFGVDLLKVVRLARMVRSLKSSKSKIFHTLKTLSYTVAGSANAFLSAILLLAVVIFVFGVMFMQGLQSWLLQSGESDADTKNALVEFFGSGTKTFLTLLACISGGIDWRDVSSVLWELGALHTWFFVLFIVFTVLCVLNILNGVFVNAAIDSAQTNKELAVDKAYHKKVAMIEQMVQWFVEADKDRSRTVSWNELRNLLADDTVRAFLHANNIDVASAGHIFLLLDRQGCGEIRPEEFVDNLITLQGEAKAIDLASLQLVCEDMAQRIIEMEGALRGALGRDDLASRPRLTTSRSTTREGLACSIDA
jgi:hypothetical protein